MSARLTVVAGLVAGAVAGWLVHFFAYGSCFESPNGPDTSFTCGLEESNGAAVAAFVAVACCLIALAVRRLAVARR